MDIEPDAEQRGGTLQEADTYLRENPIPALLGALAVGFAIGLLARAVEPKGRHPRLYGRLEDAEDYFQSIWKPMAKKTRHAYKTSAGVVRGAVDDTVERARGLDVEDYTDPAVKWFRKLWKSCCD